LAARTPISFFENANFDLCNDIVEARERLGPVGPSEKFYTSVHAWWKSLELIY
jgi:hypothetical protein